PLRSSSFPSIVRHARSATLFPYTTLFRSGGRRVFLVFGAADWRTTAWLDGRKLGDHQGGNTPFSFELTQATTGASQRLVVRVDEDRKSTRLNSSHVSISYAVFCLKKKTTT